MNIPECHDIDSVHELKTVYKAIQAIQSEIFLQEFEKQVIEKYFHYLYSIGFHQGSKQKSHQKPVVQLNEDNEIIEHFPSITIAAFRMGVPKGNLSKDIKKWYKCKGYVFMYEEEFHKKILQDFISK